MYCMDACTPVIYLLVTVTAMRRHPQRHFRPPLSLTVT